MHSKTSDDVRNRDIPGATPAKGRRGFLRQGAALVTGAASAGLAPGANAQSLAGQPWERVYGAAFLGYGQRSRFEQPVVRHFLHPYGDLAPGSGAALTPIESLEGIITPSSLHMIRNHSGTPDIDPKQHQLLLHGLVARPLVFSMESLWRYPMTTRTYFIECSGNSLRNLLPQPPQLPAGAIHGNISCSEWTGIPLRMLLEEAGLQPQAKWLLAEGADSAHMSRSIPLEKALDDAMIALYQNGERLRPEQGYPVRLLLPGWEGNMSVKWLHSLKATEGPTHTKDETSKYTDLLPDGRALAVHVRDGREIRNYATLVNHDAATCGHLRDYRHRLERRRAHSPSGSIHRWRRELGGCGAYRRRAPQVPGALSAAVGMDGSSGVLQSRATDEKGRVQPPRKEWIAQYSPDIRFHNNSIVSWAVGTDGSVKNVYV